MGKFQSFGKTIKQLIPRINIWGIILYLFKKFAGDNVRCRCKPLRGITVTVLDG